LTGAFKNISVPFMVIDVGVGAVPAVAVAVFCLAAITGAY